MLLIVTALKHEAAPIIRSFDLKRIEYRIPIYKNEDIILVITGVGQTKCAAAVGYVFGIFDGINGAINIGCAGSADNIISIGSVCLANIIDTYSGKNVHIPDILYKHGMQECRVRTCEHIAQNIQAEKNTLYDMEAYGFFTAASMFLTNDRISVVKIVSDYVFDDNLPSNSELSNLFENKSAEITAFIEKFKSYCNTYCVTNDTRTAYIVNTITKKYGLTVTRQNILKEELKNTLAYYGTIPDLTKLPDMPGSEKKHSAAAFEELIHKLKHNVDCIPCSDKPQSMDTEKDFFSHIYVENDIINDERVTDILKHFKNASVITVPHYKAVFNRKRQNVARQATHKNLILAKATNNLVYNGSDYCTAFGFDKFYYCSTVMGCIYNCSYCYLQGMYPTSNITAFINTEDFFNEIDKIDDGTPALICCSYDSDITALDSILNTVESWLEFAASKPHITFEIRTKSANIKPFDRKALSNVIIAYTLSPEQVCSQFESFAPSTEQRLNAAYVLAQSGWRVRLCIEPILVPVIDDKAYFELADKIIESGNKNKFEDIVLGGFRMNSSFFKQISALRQNCKLFRNPFINDANGFISYIGSEKFVSSLADYIRQRSDINVICYNKE